jgi:hypothetical protein
VTLLIVDMQPTYFWSVERCIEAVVREARRARHKQEAVVVLEYYNSGSTHKHLHRVLGNYERVVYVDKRTDDGSVQVIQAAHEIRGSLMKIRVCGVNTCCCVQETVEGYVKLVPDVDFSFKQDSVACSCRNPELCKRILERKCLK